MYKQSILIFKDKVTINGKFIRSRVVWVVPDRMKYPLGIRFRFVLADPFRHANLVIMDNHFPKEPHLHRLNRTEQPYVFYSLSTLLTDFSNFCEQEIIHYAR